MWTLALAGFLILVATNLIGLFAAPAFVIPGIAGISEGRSANVTADLASTWSFQSLSPPSSPAAVGTVSAAGGNPGPYLRMDLPAGQNVSGMWIQPIQAAGSPPFAAFLRADVLVQTPPGSNLAGKFYVAVDTTPGPPVWQGATLLGWYNASAGWISLPETALGSDIPESGAHYLKIIFVAARTNTAATVGFDNVRLGWITDAGVFFYLPLPFPVLLFFSQDSALFTGYFLFLVAAIVASVAYYAWRERRLIRAAIMAPPEAIGQRLRSMSALVATAQAWMGAAFVQTVIVFAYIFITGTEPPSPIGNPTPANAWVLLFELANASVYEELVFRVLLIGLPMVAGSLILRALRAPAPRTASRSLRHSLRYLFGGNLRADSSREALLAAWILLVASGTVFGLAHAPGWGWWKVIPAMVAGLAFGYVFLRHGIGAAIIAHFASDYISTTTWMGLTGSTTDALLNLLFLGLAILGAGFFIWYLMDAWRHLKDLWLRYSRPSPAAAVPFYGTAAPPGSYAQTIAAPTMPPAATPPAPSGAWGPPPASPAQEPGVVPREYAPTYHPPPYGYPPVRFRCPSCGWVEARYDNGRFTCLRCGRTA